MVSRECTAVQGKETYYALHSLGWKAFQELCITVVSEVWGQTVQGFCDSHDGGRDGAFYGSWSPSKGELFKGSFTVQCKFSAKPYSNIQLSQLKEDLIKAKRLAAKGLSNNYFLLTNSRLTGRSEEKIREAFESIPGIRRFAVFGVDRISQFIRESPRLRMLVPRVYGLGDLSQMLDERAYAQSQEILSTLGDDLAKFVITEPYRQSARALSELGFVLLLGEPACGKSTIAAALALGALDKWGCSTIKARDAGELVKHSNPQEPEQFFWVDDAFGATQLDWSATAKWNSVFPHIQAAVRRGARFVFTSRDYVYKRARAILKQSAFPLLNESQVVIRVDKLTEEEREQILYNHIRLGTQEKNFKSKVKQFLPGVAAHKRFSPEIARRLGNPLFTKELRLSTSGLDEFVNNPMDLLQEIILTLDGGSRSALAVIYMRGGSLPSPMSLTKDEEQAAELLGGSKASIIDALIALDGTLVSQVLDGGMHFWRFKHPTVRDALGKIVAENRELMDIYLTGTPLDKLLGEISCGNVQLQGVKVIVPADRFDLVIKRLEPYCRTRREAEDRAKRFLSYRCDKSFLTRFCERNPQFVEMLRVGSYLNSVPDVGVIVRLHEFDLLPEALRQSVVRQIRELAVETPDSGFLHEDIRQLFEVEEFDELMMHIKTVLIPKLSDQIDTWHSNWTGQEDPEEHFDLLESALKDYREAFESDEAVVSQISRALQDLDQLVEDLRSEYSDQPEFDRAFEVGEEKKYQSSGRSIFDDVDQ